MRPFWKEKKLSKALNKPSPSLPTRAAPSYFQYHDKPVKGPRPLRIIAAGLLGLIIVVYVLRWALSSGNERKREQEPKVVWRDFSAAAEAGETVLIAVPMKNAIEHIWHFFHMVDSLDYPRHLLQIGVLVSDSSDRTYERALELADERQKRRSRKERYGKITVLNKDFVVGKDLDVGFDNIGKARHSFPLQIMRRKLLAQSRSWLVSAILHADVDWVVWIDVDVVDYGKDLLHTLIAASKANAADVVAPNCMWKTYNEMGSYDRNNWRETPASLEMKQQLGPNDILIEGYDADLKTFRENMADMYPPTADTPEVIELDGVGGCTALVKASIHRSGATFPSYPVDHQLETEGFAQMVKLLGGKIIGLPKVYVYHGLYG